MNKKMNSHGEFLKLLGSHLNISILVPNIDPTKDEFPTQEVLTMHTLFQYNNLSHFEDHNSWHYFPKVGMNKFDGCDPLGWVTQMEHYLSPWHY
jgi:hypothetical protein